MSKNLIALFLALLSIEAIGQSDSADRFIRSFRLRAGGGIILQDNPAQFTSANVYFSAYRQLGLTYQIRAEFQLRNRFTSGIAYQYTSTFIKSSRLQRKLGDLTSGYYVQPDSVISTKDIFLFGPFIAFSIPVIKNWDLRPSAGISWGWFEQTPFRHSYKDKNSNYFYVENFNLKSSFAFQQNIGLFFENKKRNDSSYVISLAGFELMASHTAIRGEYEITRTDVLDEHSSHNTSFKMSGIAVTANVVFNIFTHIDFPLKPREK